MSERGSVYIIHPIIPILILTHTYLCIHTPTYLPTCLCVCVCRLNVDIDDLSDDYEATVRHILYHILPLVTVQSQLEAERVTYTQFIDRLVYELMFFDLKQSPLYRLSVTGPVMKRHVDSVTDTTASTPATAESVSVRALGAVEAAVTSSSSSTGSSVTEQHSAHRRTRQVALLEHNTQINKVSH